MDVRTTPAPEQSQLREYLGVIRSRFLVIVVAVMVTTAVALGLTLRQTSIYEASADVLLQPRISELALGKGFAQEVDADTEIQVMQSGTIRSRVAEALGHSPRVTITRVGTTSVARITVSSSDPAQAAHDANVFASTYAETRRQTTVDELLATSAQLQARIVDLDAEISGVNSPLDALDVQIANASTAARPGLQEQRDDLLTQIASKKNSLESRRSAYADQLDQLQLETNLTVSGGAQVVSQATEPSSPVSPKPLRNGGIALGIGLVLGLGLAFLFDHLDDRIHGKEDAERASGGLTVVGMIPSVAGWRNPKEPELVTVAAPNSPPAEAYRSLRTSLQFLGLERDTKVVQVTSSTSGEGKTTTVANLAVSLSGAGKRVIIVDCDLRRPRIHSFFGIDHNIGLTSVLLGETNVANAVHPATGNPRLAVLPSGPVPPNPSELLALRRFGELIDACKAESDFVLLDSPPVLPVADARILSAVADVTFLIVTAEKSAIGDVERSVEILQQVDAPLLGTVLNAIPTKRGMGYRYGYDYYYGYGYNSAYSSESARPSKPSRRSRRKEKKRSKRGQLPAVPPSDDVSAAERASRR